MVAARNNPIFPVFNLLDVALRYKLSDILILDFLVKSERLFVSLIFTILTLRRICWRLQQNWGGGKYIYVYTRPEKANVYIYINIHKYT